MPNLSQLEHNPPSYKSGIGLYLHVPFCQTKCQYCDFNTYAGIEDQIDGYIRAVKNELAGWGKLLSRPKVRTVFLGGGTPSYLPAEGIASVLETIHQAFDVESGAEITMECNPGDVNPEKASTWIRSGINRVSMGAQTFDDGLLALLGRRHTSFEAKQSFDALRQLGFKNLSLDLMYGLPHQALAHWSETLDVAMAMAPDHISLYSLQIEPGTPLSVDVKTGRYPVPDDDLAADMYEEAQRKLATQGFGQYEISNWAKPGMESRHNLIYWHNEPYLGVGPGAHSWFAGQRFANLKSPRRYTTVVGEDYKMTGFDPVAMMRNPAGPVDQVDVTTPAIDVSETMMMGMRLNEGISLEKFLQRFGTHLRLVFPREIKQLLGLGLVELTSDALRLSERGRLLGNEVFAEFITDE